MKFLFISLEALSIDLAYVIRQEGNDVKFFTQNATEKDVGDGFVDKIDSWEDQVDWADLVVFDDIGFGKIAEKLRAEGKKVVGGSLYTDKLENEREYGSKSLQGQVSPFSLTGIFQILMMPYDLFTTTLEDT